jgi:hypothetical protein
MVVDDRIVVDGRDFVGAQLLQQILWIHFRPELKDKTSTGPNKSL